MKVPVYDMIHDGLRSRMNDLTYMARIPKKTSLEVIMVER